MARPTGGPPTGSVTIFLSPKFPLPMYKDWQFDSLIRFEKKTLLYWVIPENNPYHPHRGNWKFIPPTPLDVLIHLLLSETIFSASPSSNFLCGGSVDLFCNDPFEKCFWTNFKCSYKHNSSLCVRILF
jgi:hypothetical protein